MFHETWQKLKVLGFFRLVRNQCHSSGLQRSVYLMRNVFIFNAITLAYAFLSFSFTYYRYVLNQFPIICSKMIRLMNIGQTVHKSNYVSNYSMDGLNHCKIDYSDRLCLEHYTYWSRNIDRIKRAKRLNYQLWFAIMYCITSFVSGNPFSEFFDIFLHTMIAQSNIIMKRQVLRCQYTFELCVQWRKLQMHHRNRCWSLYRIAMTRHINISTTIIMSVHLEQLRNTVFVNLLKIWIPPYFCLILWCSHRVGLKIRFYHKLIFIIICIDSYYHVLMWVLWNSLKNYSTFF